MRLDGASADQCSVRAIRLEVSGGAIPPREHLQSFPIHFRRPRLFRIHDLRRRRSSQVLSLMADTCRIPVPAERILGDIVKPPRLPPGADRTRADTPRPAHPALAHKCAANPRIA